MPFYVGAPVVQKDPAGTLNLVLHAVDHNQVFASRDQTFILRQLLLGHKVAQHGADRPAEERPLSGADCRARQRTEHDEWTSARHEEQRRTA